ncbi:MAG: tRNA (adenine-N(6)-)-methyltransferase, partial [Pricia sp.]|nr:tRNA (adenine-N(6)-)-methyltransferase [Pricia sp.]
VEEFEEKYDLIICNPPFYTEDVSSGDVSRDKARQSRSMPFSMLLEGVSMLLENNGMFSTIIPFKEEKRFLALAAKFKLYPLRITHVRGNPTSNIKRSLLEFAFTDREVKIDELTIELKRHLYTPEYIALTKDFYLNM